MGSYLLKLKKDLPAKHAKGREKREFQELLPTISGKMWSGFC